MQPKIRVVSEQDSSEKQPSGDRGARFEAEHHIPPLHITFRDLAPSPAIAARVTEKALELERFYGRITSCHVLVEAHHRHHRKGRLYHIRVEIVVPGGEVIASRERQMHQAHQDVYVAIRDAFDAAVRRLEDHVRRWRGDVKAHRAAQHGRVVRLFSVEGHGFIESAGTRPIYFHRNAVIDGEFDRLRIGSRVRYVVHEGEGEKGPQASTVHRIANHHRSESRKGAG
jgi:ribosome-associated translation inhibitor RaiA